MLALPVVIIFVACAILAATTGSAIPPAGYLTIGLFCLIVANNQIVHDRRRSSWMRKAQNGVNLAAWFESKLGDPVRVYALATSAAVNLPTGLDKGELSTAHGFFNAPLMAGARALTNRLSRALHVKGLSGSFARLIPVDDGVVFLVLGSRGLTVWRADPRRLRNASPVYLRGFAHGSQLARVTTHRWTAVMTGRFLVRLRFTDGSRYDYRAYDPTLAAAFQRSTGVIQLR